MTHRTEGHSAKLSALTDLEYRVWCQYRLSANDLGVMSDEPSQIQADNTSLRSRPFRTLRKALDRLIELTLVQRFAHQGQAYLFSPDWQDYQNVKWPRETFLPVPAGQAFASCSAETQKLIRAYLTAVAKRTQKRSETPVPIAPVLDEPLEVLQSDSISLLPLARTGVREVAHANAEVSGERERGPGRRAALMPPAPKNAAFAGKFVVPDFLDAEFDRKSGRPYEERQAWYRALDAEWRDRTIGEDDLKFLRARFAEWVGTTPSRGATPKPQPAYATWRDRCAHTPACSTPDQCKRLQLVAESSPEQTAGATA